MSPRMIACECGEPMFPKAHKCDVCKVTCECGSVKSAHAQTCRRCCFLDGATDGKWSVICAIRVSSAPPTTREISDETGRSVSNVMHIIERLRRVGRVRVVGGDEGWRAARFALDEPAHIGGA